MEELEIITTSDGSHTLRNTRLNETYHSVHGALQESMHVFIRNGLQHFFGKGVLGNASVLEVGFGTGLNALVTLQYARRNKNQIRYTTLEPFPLDEHIWSKLNYGGDPADQTFFRKLHAAVWESEVAISPDFLLTKRKASHLDYNPDGSFDVIYFDAFAPAVQPELWTYASLEKIFRVMKRGSVFVTYCAKGQLKRDLRSLGLTVETLPGPPGKNEMVRACRD